MEFERTAWRKYEYVMDMSKCRSTSGVVVEYTLPRYKLEFDSWVVQLEDQRDNLGFSQHIIYR